MLLGTLEPDLAEGYRGFFLDSPFHQAVMLDEVLELLVTDPEGIYVDCTLGGGGHSAGILGKLGGRGRLIGLDRDLEAVEHAKGRLGGDGRVEIAHAPFSRLGEILASFGVAPGGVAGVLFDLGVSSHQLDVAERGFTFAPGAELDMRMDRRQTATAGRMLVRWSERELASVLRNNADVERAAALARSIKRRLAAGRIPSSDLLRAAVESLSVRNPERRNQMLARVFQAIRMEVNEELAEIGAGLDQAVEALRPGGRLAVLSYHSVEDRKVKETLAGHGRDCICPPRSPVCVCGGGRRRLKKVPRRPMTPSDREIRENARARSAKLRVEERI